MRGSETIIFDGKTLSELFKDIYDTSRLRRNEIRDLVTELSKLVVSATDAVNIAPIIQQYLDVGVKNDEQLVKLATIVQRIITAEAYKNTAPGDASELISEEEKEQLLKNGVEELKQAAEELEDELTKLPASSPAQLKK